jgi:hypothetical protein
MNAGREVDALIAEKVMGWRKVGTLWLTPIAAQPVAGLSRDAKGGRLVPRASSVHKRGCPNSPIRVVLVASGRCCGVEQLVARHAHNVQVVRSSRTPATNL